jgi:hypothetical protein
MGYCWFQRPRAVAASLADRVETLPDVCRRNDTALSGRHPEVAWTATVLAAVRPTWETLFVSTTGMTPRSSDGQLLNVLGSRLVADADGTLFTQEKVLTARAIEAVKQLRNADTPLPLRAAGRRVG